MIEVTIIVTPGRELYVAQFPQVPRPGDHIRFNRMKLGDAEMKVKKTVFTAWGEAPAVYVK